jgi:hypothetical protein
MRHLQELSRSENSMRLILDETCDSGRNNGHFATFDWRAKNGELGAGPSGGNRGHPIRADSPQKSRSLTGPFTNLHFPMPHYFGAEDGGQRRGTGNSSARSGRARMAPAGGPIPRGG